MHSESSGTLTAICMLIPLVGVPYFAIRGTDDLGNKLPSLDGGEAVAFADEGFKEDAGSATTLGGDAPPFPGGESTVVSQLNGGGSGDWSAPDPFAATPSPNASLDQPSPSDPFSEFDQLTQQQPSQPSGGLKDTRLRNFPAKPNVPAKTAGNSREMPRTEVAAEWERGIASLKAVGMRNYRVESLKDKSVYYVSAFFTEKASSVMRRFEGEGRHPLTALKSVIQQVDEWRNGNSW